MELSGLEPQQSFLSSVRLGPRVLELSCLVRKLVATKSYAIHHVLYSILKMLFNMDLTAVGKLQL